MAKFRAEYVVLLSLVTTIHCEMEGYIVRGENASIYQYPHSAYISILCKRGVPQSWMCGASIINQEILMTAAHCVDSCKMHQKISISTGSAQRNNGHKTCAQTYVIHESYRPKTSENDIALIRMRTRTPFNDQIRRVAIMRLAPDNSDANIAGWGLINDVELKQSDYLMELAQKVWKKSTCEHYYGDLPDSCFCASHDERDRYLAPGDSGSALVINGYIQIGIVSYKIPKIAKHLIVYTNVSYFYKWISYHSKKLYCN